MSKAAVGPHHRHIAVWMTRSVGLTLLVLLSGCGGRRAIMGRVIDEHGAPIHRAEIRTEPTTDIVLTNDNGAFTIRQALAKDGGFSPIKADQYTLIVRQHGYVDLVMDLDYDGGVMQLPILEMVPTSRDFNPLW